MIMENANGGELFDFIVRCLWLVGKRTASTASKLEKVSEEKIRKSVHSNSNTNKKISIISVVPRRTEKEDIKNKKEHELSVVELMSWEKKEESNGISVTPPPPPLPPNIPPPADL